MKYYTSKNPEWLNILAPEEFNDEELFRIVIFMFFILPVKDYLLWAKRYQVTAGTRHGRSHSI